MGRDSSISVGTANKPYQSPVSETHMVEGEKSIPESCPLTSTGELWYEYTHKHARERGGGMEEGGGERERERLVKM